MGIGPRIASASVADHNCVYKDAVDKQPNPRKYTLISQNKFSGYLVLVLRYDNVTNYEGEKILMFDKGTSLRRLLAQGIGIDPHFLNHPKYVHPIARFEPTALGMAMAVRLCTAMASTDV